MITCTREEFCEALKVPGIMGRGEAYGVVIGDRRFKELARWSEESDGGLVAGELHRGCAHLLGMNVIVTARHPDALFAVTAEEYRRLLLELDTSEFSCGTAVSNAVSSMLASEDSSEGRQQLQQALIAFANKCVDVEGPPLVRRTARKLCTPHYTVGIEELKAGEVDIRDVVKAAAHDIAGELNKRKEQLEGATAITVHLTVEAGQVLLYLETIAIDR